MGYSPSRLFEYNAIRSAVSARAAQIGLGAALTPTTSDLGEGTIRLQVVAANASEPCSVSFWRRKLDIKLEKTVMDTSNNNKMHKGIKATIIALENIT